VAKDASAAGVGFELVPRQESAAGSGIEVRMGVFKAGDVWKLKRLAHGHNADVTAIGSTLQADFDDAIQIFLYHVFSPVAYSFDSGPQLLLRNWFL
jgi:hypothetical protein